MTTSRSLPTPRACFARGRLAYGSPPNRKSITPSHQLALVDRYPGLYRMARRKPGPRARPFSSQGFAVGGGWLDIIQRLSEELSADPNLFAVQVKEKYGLLTVYLDVDEATARPSRLIACETQLDGKTALLSLHLSPMLAPNLEAALGAARKESSRICEICGAPGVLGENERGWVSVRCDSCKWLDVMERVCQDLELDGETMTFGAFAADANQLNASKRHLKQLGDAAAHQPLDRRLRLRRIPWARVDLFQSDDNVASMTAQELWTFISRQAPAIARALR